MNKIKLDGIIRDDNIVIPIHMFRLHNKFNLNLEEFTFLMYLVNKQFKLFDPEAIASELNMDIMEVMGYISILADKGMISLDIDKDNGLIEEKINLDGFYNKVSLAIIEELEEEEHKDGSIYKDIEREFNRSLTPMERDVVKEWLDNDYGDDMIHEALKEASLNGVANLRYIDKILHEWHKKGISKKEDIKTSEPVEPVSMDVYNWLDDDEEL